MGSGEKLQELNVLASTESSAPLVQIRGDIEESPGRRGSSRVRGPGFVGVRRGSGRKQHHHPATSADELSQDRPHRWDGGHELDRLLRCTGTSGERDEDARAEADGEATHGAMTTSPAHRTAGAREPGCSRRRRRAQGQPHSSPGNVPTARGAHRRYSVRVAWYPPDPLRTGRIGDSGQRGTMRLQTTYRNCQPTRADERLLERRIGKMEKRLRRVNPELVDLQLIVQRHARRPEYTGNFRLVVEGDVMAAMRNKAPTLKNLLVQAFEDLEEQLEARSARMTRGRSARKRGARSADGVAASERVLDEKRALLDQAMAGDQAAFARLADSIMPGVRAAIFDALTERGRETTDAELDAALGSTLTAAFARLKEKPDEWSLDGWLMHVAREEVLQRLAA